MKQVDVLHHFVHLGFDKNEQPEFESSLLNRVEQIKDLSGAGLTQALIMIDEPILSSEELAYTQMYKLAETINYFIVYHHFHSSLPSLGLLIDGKMNDKNEYDQEIINDLSVMLGPYIWSLRQPYDELVLGIKDYNEFFSYEDSFEKSDTVYYFLMTDLFIQIFKKLWKKHKTRLLAETIESGSTGECFKIPGNLKRRTNIYNKLVDLLGEDTIINTYMEDGDLYSLQDHTDYSLPEHERSFGNAGPYLENIKIRLNRKRIRSYYQRISNNLRKNGLIITRQTKHIIGGEYYKRCVNNYSKLLCDLFLTTNAGVNIDETISLIREDDIEMFIDKLVGNKNGIDYKSEKNNILYGKG